MTTSEARIRANQANSLKSTGPKTPEGKEQSRKNALKHGLTGAGVVLPNEDVAEVDRRFAAFREELQPSGELGEALARRAAILSVRLDRCVSYETASLRGRIRQAEADFVAPEGVDAETLAQLRAEAKARAMYDPSKEATLARRYEAATERSFFKVLKEFRQVEKQARASDPAVMQAIYQQSLASFLELEKEGAALEAMYLEPHERSPSFSPMPLNSACRPKVGSPVDVPITIGRRP